MAKNIWLIPKERMFIEGREVIKILCKPSGSDEFKEKERLSKLGKAKRRPIKCLTNGKVYSSIAEASRELILHPGAISKVCNGKQKSTNGYTFEYQ